MNNTKMIKKTNVDSSLKGDNMGSLRTTVIGCGGAGSNITAHLKNGMEDESYIEYLTIDTSASNKKDGIGFYHIKTDNSDAENLTGSGGIRGTNLDDIMPGCKKFVNEKGLHKHEGVVVLVFSTSGGSGNVIACGLLNILLAYDVAVYCIYVHDSSNLQFATYGKKVTESLFTISQSFKVALPVSYFLNTIDKNLVNDTILNEFKMVMKLHDTDNLNEIDNQDMKNLYKGINYINMVPGVYAIAVTSIKHVEETLSRYEVLIARSLTNSDLDPIKSGQVNHNKNGTSKDGTEVALLLINNFDKQYNTVKKGLESYNKTVTEFKLDDDVKVSNNGIVF